MSGRAERKGENSILKIRACTSEAAGSVPESQLSEENLKKLERETLNEMDRSVAVSDRVRKRALSRQASFSELSQDTASQRSQKSSVSNSFYRYLVLDQAGLYIRPEPPPVNIQAQMDDIFNVEISEERRKEITSIAKKISQRFISKLRGAHRKDDLVELIYKALHMMHEDETFDFSRKAGIIPFDSHVYIPVR